MLTTKLAAVQNFIFSMELQLGNTHTANGLLGSNVLDSGTMSLVPGSIGECALIAADLVAPVHHKLLPV